VRKNCSGDWKKKLKFKAEGREFANILRSLNRTIYSHSKRSEQFLKQNAFLNLFLEISEIEYNGTIQIQIGKNNWDLETYRKSY
jgi:hypothetical protein